MNIGDLINVRSKWEAYAVRLERGDNGGSLFVALFLIAKTACTDIAELTDLIDDIYYELQVAINRIDALEKED